MAYNIYKSNGDLLSIVDDGFADINSASVALIGKNFPGYGQYFNENFIRLTENFSSDNAPDNQLTGQLWYQTSTSQLKIWNSTEWVSAGKPNIVNDNASTNRHFITFVDSFGGTPDFKVAANRGITFIPSYGFFGIGVENPMSKLTISTNICGALASPSPNTNTSVHTLGDNGKDNVVIIESYGGNGPTYNIGNSPVLAMRRNNGTGAGREAVRASDVIGRLVGQGYNGTSATTARVGINFEAPENWSATSTPTRIVFYTTPTGTITSANAMGILSNRTVECYGNVSIQQNLTTTGFIRAGGDVTAYYTSDERLKTNILPIDNALAKTMSLNGVTFNWNDLATDKDLTVREAGLIAQDLLKILPEAVTERDNGYLAVQYEKIIPLLVEAIKELSAEINALKKTV